MAITGLKNLCAPASFYFTISMIAMVIMIIYNAGNTSTYCIGYYSCDVPSTFFIFVIKFMYILLWTWILNLICIAGVPNLSWFLVLIPFILFFVLVALLLAKRTIM